MGFLPRKNEAFVFYAELYEQATDALIAGATLATGDVKVALDDGAPANITTLPVVDADLSRRIKVSLSAAECNGSVGVSVMFNDIAGAQWYPRHYYFPIQQPISLPGQEDPPASAFIEEIISHLYKAYRNPKDSTASTQKIYNDAGTTVDQKATVSSDGTTTSVGKMVSGP